MTQTMVFIIGILFLVLLPLIFWLRKLKKEKMEKVMEKLKGKNLLIMSQGANFFGQKSRGFAQMRGNGVLVLTDEMLFFEMWVPSKELSIPVSSITGVETVRSFLGKTKGWPLLKINFTNESKEADSAAWLVDRLEEWTKIIEGKTGSKD
ncbi:hypothetical protein KA005_20885 [bacterium]|nr:hypothetical protein [bacterium]